MDLWLIISIILIIIVIALVVVTIVLATKKSSCPNPTTGCTGTNKCCPTDSAGNCFTSNGGCPNGQGCCTLVGNVCPSSSSVCGTNPSCCPVGLVGKTFNIIGFPPGEADVTNISKGVYLTVGNYANRSPNSTLHDLFGYEKLTNPGINGTDSQQWIFVQSSGGLQIQIASISGANIGIDPTNGAAGIEIPGSTFNIAPLPNPSLYTITEITNSNPNMNVIFAIGGGSRAEFYAAAPSVIPTLNVNTANPYWFIQPITS